ncbi:hypothetical protein F4604DRAFT_1682184 [Suillus subluteus]|nr:hypothetical protein F4604DRAFT_1682184 [Suillus subluteus]
MAPIFSENVISLGNGIIKGWNLRPNFEFFPHNFKLDHFLVRKLRAELNWFHAATMFSNREATEKIITRLASLGPDGNIIEPGVTLFGRLYHMLHMFAISLTSLVNSLDIKDFVDNFSSQITAQMTLAYYLDQGMTVVIGVLQCT